MASSLDVLHAAKLAFNGNTPNAYLIQGAQQTVVTGVDTAITFTTGLIDSWLGWKTGTPTRYTVQVPGVYTISGNVIWDGNSGGRRFTYIRVNGNIQVPGSAGDLAPTSTDTITIAATTCRYLLAAGDYVEIVANQDTGGDLKTHAASSTSTFISSMTVSWVHD